MQRCLCGIDQPRLYLRLYRVLLLSVLQFIDLPSPCKRCRLFCQKLCFVSRLRQLRLYRRQRTLQRQRPMPLLCSLAITGPTDPAAIDAIPSAYPACTSGASIASAPQLRGLQLQRLHVGNQDEPRRIQRKLRGV